MHVCGRRLSLSVSSLLGSFWFTRGAFFVLALLAESRTVDAVLQRLYLSKSWNCFLFAVRTPSPYHLIPPPLWRMFFLFFLKIWRSVLGSGGTPFSLLMPRSVDFRTYHELLKLNVPSARDVRLLLSLLQVCVRAYVRACCILCTLDLRQSPLRQAGRQAREQEDMECKSCRYHRRWTVP